MSPLILYNNKILLVEGKLAADINCCCGKNPCQCCWSPSNKRGCNNGPQITVNAGTPPSIKIEFEDSASGECGGTCMSPQGVSLYTKIETKTDGGVLTADLIGNVETFNPGFEALTVTINASDGSSVSKTIQSVKNRALDANSDGTNIPCADLGDCCQMEIVSDSMSINLPSGCHNIAITSETRDGLWHKNAYHEVNFTMQGGDPVACASELCEKYICDPNQGCTLSPIGSYNSLEECGASCIERFICVLENNQVFCQSQGLNTTGLTKIECETDCVPKSYDCDINYGCIPRLDTNGEFLTLQECQQSCLVRYVCDPNNGCSPDGFKTTGLTYDQCVATCVPQSYNCSPFEGCIPKYDNSGGFATLIECNSQCIQRYECDYNYGCYGIGFLTEGLASCDGCVPVSANCYPEYGYYCETLYGPGGNVNSCEECVEGVFP